MKPAAVILAISLFAAPCAARTITVDANGTGDYPTIQAAIDDCNNGDVIILKPGTYTGPGNQTVESRRAAITIRSTDPNDPNIVAATVMDCNGTGRGFLFPRLGDTACVVRGLTIVDANSTGGTIHSMFSNLLITDCTLSGNSGGSGVYLYGATIEIINCTITANASAGIYCDLSQTAQKEDITITNCIITSNSGEGVHCWRWFSTGPVNLSIADSIISRNAGNGVYCDYRPPGPRTNLTITDSVISNNAGSGVAGGPTGGAPEGSLTNCAITGNGGAGIARFMGDVSGCLIADNSQSGILGLGGSITDSTITGNTTETTGGGIRSGSSNITRCTISNNTAARGGGGIYSDSGHAQIANSIISGNTSGYESGGSGICVSKGDLEIADSAIVYNTIERAAFSSGDSAIRCVRGSCSFTNCTIGENCAGAISCSDAQATLTNSIIWATPGTDGSKITLTDGSTVTISWSDLQNGQQDIDVEPGSTVNWGPGNIDTDPCLTTDYFHLKSDSPCIDAGDPSYTGGATDIDAEPRLYPPRIDMGADEFIDTDGDGLPDWWEAEYFGSPTAADPDGNPDNDSRPNIREYPLGSDPTSSSDYYVNPADGNDTWDGLAPVWDGEHGPKQTIQAAVDACPAGQVVLAPATYTGDGNRDVDLKGKVITVRSIDPEAPDIVAATIIDCQGSESEPHRGFHLQSNERPHSVIAGLTITGGCVTQGGVHPATTSGGAIISVWPAYPTITLCNITGNMALGGGGIYAGGGRFTRCKIADNWAYNGGGIYVSRSTIEGCIIVRNWADDDGGGIYSLGANVSDSIIANNYAESSGGGMYLWTSATAVGNCLIKGNKARQGGGAIYSFGSDLAITNSTIVDNLAHPYGQAIHSYRATDAFVNSILRNITPQEIEGDPVISYSNVRGGWAGEGNIDIDPRFADPGYWDPNGTPEDPTDDFWLDGDYHLKSQAGRWDPNSQTWVVDNVTSPCIDAGNPLDPIGLEPFPNGGIINMGAYGGTPEASKSYFGEPVCETIVAGDVNGDCIIDFRDVYLMALHWCEDNSP